MQIKILVVILDPSFFFTLLIQQSPNPKNLMNPFLCVCTTNTKFPATIISSLYYCGGYLSDHLTSALTTLKQ